MFFTIFVYEIYHINAMKGRTQQYYDTGSTIKGKSNKKAAKKAKANKAKYQKKYDSQPHMKKKRAELNKINRKNHKAGKSKVGDKLDVSHTKSGKTKLQHQSANRASKSNTIGDKKARGKKN